MMEEVPCRGRHRQAPRLPRQVLEGLRIDALYLEKDLLDLAKYSAIGQLPLEGTNVEKNLGCFMVNLKYTNVIFQNECFLSWTSISQLKAVLMFSHAPYFCIYLFFCLPYLTLVLFVLHLFA